MSATGKKKLYIILILGLLTAIGPLSIDMYLPAFPEIAKSLNTTVASVMLSLSSFFIGISLGQFIYGPLLERYGRKKPLYFGLVLYLLASVGCALATSVNALIAFRLLQALGGCAGMVASRAIVRDLFKAHEMAKVFSTLMLVVAVSPIIAPTLGGYIAAVASWRLVFAVLLLVNVVIIAGVYFFLPESKQPDPAYSLRAGAITKSFIGILINPRFYAYALTGAIAYGGLSAYVSGSPNVFMETFGASEQQFGWIFAIVAVGIITASQVNNLALRKYSSEKIIQFSLACQSALGLTLALLAFFGLAEMYSTIAIIFLFLACQGFVFPNSSALSLAAFGHNAGTASALMGGIQMAVGAGASALVSVLQDHTAFPMSAVMAFCSMSALGVFVLGRRIIANITRKEALLEAEVKMISTL